jgi:hypothetical protein
MREAKKDKRLGRGVGDTGNGTNREDECLVKIHGRCRSGSEEMALIEAEVMEELKMVCESTAWLPQSLSMRDAKVRKAGSSRVEVGEVEQGVAMFVDVAAGCKSKMLTSR